VFTSAGTRNNLAQWVAATERSWDLLCVCYADDEATAASLRREADFFLQRKGSKFQNLYALQLMHPDILKGYDFVWVLDDDLVMSPGQIEDMFALARAWDLWVCQPAFSRRGRVSHAITTRESAANLLRIVTFVEVTCPLFRRDKLELFLDHYDGSLVGMGIDHWFAHVLQSDRNPKFAVVDAIEVVNPRESEKGGIREINQLQALGERRRHWRQVQRRKRIPEAPHLTLSRIGHGAKAAPATAAAEGAAFARKAWPAEFLDIRQQLPDWTPRVIFDVGANRGQSCLAYAAAFPDCVIHAFEPVPATFERLARAVRPHPSIKVHNLGLSREAQAAPMVVAGASTSARVLGADHPPGDDLPIVRLEAGASFARAQGVERICFLKIDTEGHDLAVLEGFTPMLGAIDFIQVEAGMNPYNRTHVPFRALEDFLRARGFLLFRLYEQAFEWQDGGRPVLRRANPLFIRQDLVPLDGIA
jgi:FkbM family methyltransferase